MSNSSRRALLIVVTALFVVTIIAYNLIFRNEQPQVERTELSVPNIKISVLNGCGIDGAASEVKNFFIEGNYRNIDVIYWSNVERGLFIYGKTIIVVKRKDPVKLEYLMNLTGIERRIFALNENSFEDMQIVVGKDYKRYFE